MPTDSTRTGGKILVDHLVVQGVERVDGIPGESDLAALDAMRDAPIEVKAGHVAAGDRLDS